MAVSKPKPYNLGRWTVARFNAFVKGALRKAHWPPKYEVIRRAYVQDGINEQTGRRVKLYRCNGCSNLFMQKDLKADHIDPVVDPEVGFVDWNTFIERLYCPIEGFQVLCNECHNTKTAEERTIRENKGG